MQLRVGQFWRFRKHHIKIDRARQVEQAKDTKRETKVANAVDDKRLHRGGTCGWFLKVEPDQQIGCNAHAFPTKEHLNQVVRGHQHQHGEGKERQVGEEACAVRFRVRKILVMGHVAE